MKVPQVRLARQLRLVYRGRASSPMPRRRSSRSPSIITRRADEPDSAETGLDLHDRLGGTSRASQIRNLDVIRSVVRSRLKSRGAHGRPPPRPAFALRLLCKDKAFAIADILTLAICLGANSAIFTVVRSVLLRPLPYPESDRLVTDYDGFPGAGVERAGISVPNYYDRVALTDVLDRWRSTRTRRQGSAKARAPKAFRR